MSATLPPLAGTATLDLTEADAFAVLGDFLTLILAPSVNVIRAEINRVPEPPGSDFVVMTAILRERIATNVGSYADVPGAGKRQARQSTRVTMQLDVHGPASADNAQIISTLLRDSYACEQFATSGLDIVPLYAGEPRQAPFRNGEDQIEFRWTLDAVLQVNASVATPQQFAGAAAAQTVPADVFSATAIAALPTPTP